MRTLDALAIALALATACSNGDGNGNGNGDARADAAGEGGNPAGPDATVGNTDAGSLPGDAGTGAVRTYGQVYTGGEYHLGPVDYAETQFHNACAPGGGYDSRVQSVEGSLLAGLWNGIPNVENYCDACVFITTGQGRSALLRVVTYGETTPNSIDVSPEAYAILNAGENPRAMSWQFAECPDSGPMQYEFQSASNEWWTSLWVRNARVPVAKVEVQSVNHAAFVELARGNGDGTLTDASGFGQGSFTIRSTGIDGQVVTETFAWPGNGLGGAFLTGTTNFR